MSCLHERSTGSCVGSAALALLVTVVSCADATAPESAAILEVTTHQSGVDLDPDGFALSIDGRSWGTVGPSETVTLGSLAPGRHSVVVAGAAANCVLIEPTRTITLVAGSTVQLLIEAACTGTTGVLEVSVTTSGGLGTSSGYSIRLDDEGGRPIGPDAVLEFTPVSGGAHTVELGGLDVRCSVDVASRSVTVRTGLLVRDTARVAFAVWCNRPAVRIVTATAGPDPDEDGYEVSLDCEPFEICARWYLGTNDTILTDLIPPGPHTLRLEGVAPNCAVSGAGSQSVELSTDTVEVAFLVGCAALGYVRVTTATAGLDLDANGYRVETFDGLRPMDIGGVPVNGSIVTPGLAPDVPIPVRLEGVSVNCAVQGPNPVTLSAPSGGVIDVTFDVTCEAAPQLAAARDDSGNWDVYTLSLNDEQPRRLTYTLGYDAEPSWSPDGSRIAFTSDRHGKAEIFTMNGDGSGAIRLTSLPAGMTAAEPAWSPDGSRIAYTTTLSGQPAINVMDADGANPRWLAPGSSPAWSPDGTKIAFTALGNVKVIDLVGSAAPVDLGTGLNPSWSPSGLRIAFEEWYEDWEWGWTPDGIWVMNTTGSGRTRLWDRGVGPAWSPDGRWIAFELSDRLVVGSGDGSGVTREVGVSLRQPAWRR